MHGSGRSLLVMSNITPDATSLKNEIRDYIYFRLGGNMIDVELDPEHYNMCITQALRRYRQRAANSVESSYMFLPLVENQQEYILPSEVQEVRQVYRRTIGSTSSGAGGSTQFEPFEAAYINMYMLQAGRIGGQASYEMFAQYQELNARMFGGFINFEWNSVTKKLVLLRKFNSTGEIILLWVYNVKPDHILLQDTYAQPWIQDYSYALAKFTLGEARSKFSVIAGPQGGSTLNGSELKSEAQQELLALDEELKKFVDRSTPYSFIVG